MIMSSVSTQTVTTLADHDDVISVPPQLESPRMERDARSFYDLGVRTTDLQLAQSCILQAVAMNKEL